MATRPKAVIESHNGEEFSPITIAKNVLTDDGQSLHDILSDRKEDMMTPTIENSSSMFKVGQGDNVDYSENVVDGAYESCVLKGVTKFIDNNTGKTLDSFVENRDLSLIDCKSPILSNTGKNLIDIKKAERRGSTKCSLINNGDGSITLVGDGDGSGEGIVTTSCYAYLEEGKTYTFSFESDGQYSTTNGTDTVEAFLLKDGSASEYIHHMTNFITTFTCGRTGDYYVRFDVNKNNTTHKFWNIQLTEGATVYPYEPYKSNILSCNGDKIELTEDMFEQGTINEAHAPKDYNAIKNQSSGAYFNKRVRLKSPLPIKPNTTYIINVSNNYDVFVGFCLDGVFLDNYIGYKGNIAFTTPSNCNEIALVVKNGNDKDLLIANFSIDNIRLSEVDKTIVLRSLPNGVCDTLNVETGEYVQRIGEVVLNGSNDETFVEKGGWINDTHMSFDFKVSDAVKGKTNVITVISDKFKSVIRNSQSASSTDEFITNTSSGFIFVMIRKNRLNTQDLVGFKQWLSQNTLTVQYELATPVIKTVDLSGYPFAYKDGHVQLSSGSIEQSLTPKVEYSVVTNRNGQIRSNQKMVERHQKQLDRLQAMILTNLVNTQYEQTLTNLKYDLKNVREEVK